MDILVDLCFKMVLSGFRSIIEYSAFDGQHYYSLQIARSSDSKIKTNPSDLKSSDDFLFYVFNRCPLDGFEITGVKFQEIIPFVNQFKKSKISLWELVHDYSQKQTELNTFLDNQELGEDLKPPEHYYPAYEPAFSIVEVTPKEQETPIETGNRATIIELTRVQEYTAMIKALGYHIDGNNGELADSEFCRWIERNAKVYRLANPVAGVHFDVGDISYCETGQHYWHPVGKTRFIRKFYVAEQIIRTPSLKERIDAIPKQDCPDSLEHNIEREGNKLILTNNSTH